MGTIKSVHKDCLEPQLILAHPTGWFKVQDVVKLNNKNISNASEFTRKNIYLINLSLANYKNYFIFIL